MRVLAVYDIAEPGRLGRVAGIMKDYGIRVLKSKFELDISDAAFIELRKRIEEVIDFEEDGVKYIPLCRNCLVKTEIIGLGKFIDPDEEYYIL